jgi:hypothetical protein
MLFRLGMVAVVVGVLCNCDGGSEEPRAQPQKPPTAARVAYIQNLRAASGTSSAAAEIELYWRVPHLGDDFVVIKPCYLPGPTAPTTPSPPAICPENAGGGNSDGPDFTIVGEHNHLYSITVFTRVFGQTEYVGRSVSIVAKEAEWDDLELAVPPEPLPGAVKLCFTAETDLDPVKQYRIRAEPLSSPAAGVVTKVARASDCLIVKGLRSGVRYRLSVSARVDTPFGHPDLTATATPD